MRVVISSAKEILYNGIAQAASDSYGVKIFFCLPIFLNRLSTTSEETAASGIIITVINLFDIALVGPLFGKSPEVAQCFGTLKNNAVVFDSEKRVCFQKIQSVFQYGCVYTFLIATPIAVLPLLFSESWLISLFQQDRQVAAIAGDFLRKISNIIPAEFISFFSMQFLLANGNTKILFLGSVILILNLLFSILLSFGLFGFPEYKMNGIVMSYSVSAWLTALLYTGALFFHADFRDLALLKHVFQSLKGKKAELIDFMKAALVPTITILTDFGIPFLLTTLSIQFGVTSQAALALTMQCLALNNLLNISFAIASVIIFGRKIGEKFKDIFTFGITINLVSTIVELILPLIVAIRSDLIIDLITKECSVAVRQSVAKLAPLIAIQNWLSGLTTSLLFQTRALNRGMFSAMTYAGCMTLGLAVACILAFAMEMKIEGIAIGYLSSTALSLIALLLTWRDSMNHSSNHACCFWFWKKNPNPQELADLAEPILGS